MRARFVFSKTWVWWLDVSLKQLAAESTMLASTNSPFAFALLPSLFILADLTHERVESIINTHSSFGRCFNERHAILLSDLKKEKEEFIRTMLIDGSIWKFLRLSLDSYRRPMPANHICCPPVPLALPQHPSHVLFVHDMFLQWWIKKCQIHISNCCKTIILTYILETFGTIYSKDQQKSFSGAHILNNENIVLASWAATQHSSILTWSLMAEYSSWPAVSKISKRHVSPSVNGECNKIVH